MNEISLLINYIINQFNKDTLVHTITMQSDYDLDSQKENIYPLVNIDFKEVDPQPDEIIGNFKIKVFQQRNSTTKPIDSKLMMDTNFIDNMNETFAIGNKFIKHFQLAAYNPANIELKSLSRFRAIKEGTTNNLDGYEFTASLSIPNKTTGC